MSPLIVCNCVCGRCTGQVAGGHEGCPYNCGRRTVAWLGQAATDAAEAVVHDAYLRQREPVPSAAVPPLGGGDRHPAPRASGNASAGGAGPQCCRPGVGEPDAHTAGESRPVSLAAIGRIMRLHWPWSSLR